VVAVVVPPERTMMETVLPDTVRPDEVDPELTTVIDNSSKVHFETGRTKANALLRAYMRDAGFYLKWRHS
jgi:hypothetical protein